MSGERNVSGHWDGIFNYPRGLGSNAFAAELAEHSGAITDDTSEVSDEGPDCGATITAIIEGERIGGGVSFVKRYDKLARAHYTVRYDGRLSDEGDEIAGEWTIPGVWSGSFIMVRRPEREAEVEERASEEAPRHFIGSLIAHLPSRSNARKQRYRSSLLGA